MKTFTTALALVLAVSAVAQDAPLTLGKTKLLFLDDRYIAEQENLTRRVNPAEKHDGPVLVSDRPWEGPVVIVYGSVVREADTWRMWYHCAPGVGYAESDDGITWTKPELDVVEIDGQKTNVVATRDSGEYDAGVLPFYYELFGVQPAHSNDPAKKYVMGYLSIQRDYSGDRPDPFHGGQRRGLGVAFSPDGIHWTAADPFTTDAICDGGTYWMYDPRPQQYVLFGRTKHIPPAVAEAWKDDAYAQANYWGRAVARVASPDFLDWDFKDPATAPVVMASDPADPPATGVYSMNVFPYESAYIALIQRFYNRPEDVFLDLQFAVSHDSETFARVSDKTPFISCGGVGEWDRFNNSVANNPPIAVGDDLRFYYGGRTYRHSPYNGPDKGESGGAIGFATVKKDRFASVGASFDGGRLTTVPLTLDGATVHLNAVSDYGEILVEALDGEGNAVATSEPVRADALDIAVAWKDGAAPPAGAPVRLRLTLKNALLYALWSE